MRINSINPFFGYKYSSINNKPAFKGVPFGFSDSVKDELDEMSDYERKCKFSAFSGNVKAMAEQSYAMAKLTEEMLDEKYGENNWVFVSIGTSPAGIAKALELRGKDVKYLPISEVRFLEEEEYKKGAKRRKHSEYIKYLDSIDLRKKNINKSDKHYIFADYTHKGKTIKYLERFAYSNGIKPKKAHFISLNNELEEYTLLKNNKELNAKVRNYFSNYCMTQKIEYFAGIPHVPYYGTDLIKKALYFADKRNINEGLFEELLYYTHLKNMESKQS